MQIDATVKRRFLLAMGFLLPLLPQGAAAQWGISTNGGQVTITSYTGSLSTVTVPSTFDGLPVTVIGDSAFADNTTLQSITLPASLTSIEEQAFFDCSVLTTINIPASVTNIGPLAFANCSKLKTIPVDPLNASFSTLAGVLFDKNQTRLLQYPGGLSGAYTVPSSVTSIVSLAFYHSGKLTSVTIPGGVADIGSGAFAGCYTLTSISVSSTNNWFSSTGGILFNKDKTTLVQCPAGKTGAYSVPDGVTRVEEYAFLECIMLTELTLPDSLAVIASGGFQYCISLGSITIPSSVVSIGSYGFFGCISMTTATIAKDGLAYLDSYVFGYCYSLETVTIYSTMSFFLSGIFYDAVSLKAVYFADDCPLLLGSSPFQGATNATVYFVEGTSGWSSTFDGRPTALWPLPGYAVTSLASMSPGKRINSTVDVPQGCTGLSVRTTGGSGDLSIYARYGTKVSLNSSTTQGTRLYPQAGTYDAYSGHAGTNEETIFLPYPAAGTWYITVYANTNVSGVTFGTLVGETGTNSIPYGGSVNVPPGCGLNSEVYYALEVPTNVGLLVVEASDTNRCPDIYLKRGSMPSSTTADRMWKGTEPTKTLISAAPSPLAGTYYVMARSSGTPTANTWMTPTTGALSAAAVGAGLIDTSLSEAQGNDLFAEASLSGTYQRVPVRLMALGHAPLSSSKSRYWNVTHGRVGSYTGPFCGADGLTNSGDIAEALDSADSLDHQVLLLDWSEGAFDDSTNWWEGEESGAWIAPVGSAASALLASVNTNRSKWNLVGHGWGSYVSYETSKKIKPVTSLVALDPARTASGYSDGKVKFSKYATHSWAFYGCSSLPGNAWQPGFYCSPTRAHTATHSFEVRMDYVAANDATFADDDILHEDIHKAFAYIVDAPAFPDFHVDSLSTSSHPWNTTETNEGSFACTGTFEPATVVYIKPQSP